MSGTVFGGYARYYDLFYRDKDYAGEARLVDGWLRAPGSAGGTLLDVGCGSGAHAREFAQLGWVVTGVDLSPAMIALARSKTGPNATGEFLIGSAAQFDLARTFSSAVSLFHVVSYQTQLEETLSMFANIRRHLIPGGRFVFDFWHGPGVLSDPPVVKIRRMEDARVRVTRISEPVHHRTQCAIEVNYEVFIEDVATGQVERLMETHHMRYYFLPELEGLLTRAGFAIELTRAGVCALPLNNHAWYGLVIARAV